MASTNRTGRVSSINYEAGTYEVTYRDRGKSVTREINAVSNGEYKMPVIGQIVSVSHNSNGTAAATTVGTIWNRTNKLGEKGYKGLFRKEYASKKSKAYERYDENTGVYTQFVDKRTGRNCKGEIFDEAAGAVSVVAGGQLQLKSRKASASITATTGVGITAGTTINLEAGTFLSMEAAGAMSVSAGGNTTESYGGKVKRTYKGDIEEDVTAKVTKTVTGEILLTLNGATVSISPAGDVAIASPTKISLDAPEVNINGASGDVVVNNISLVQHTHADSGAGKPS